MTLSEIASSAWADFLDQCDTWGGLTPEAVRQYVGHNQLSASVENDLLRMLASYLEEQACEA